MKEIPDKIKDGILGKNKEREKESESKGINKT